MKPFPLPVSMIGPGSQEVEEGPDCLDIPTDMHVFVRPSSDFIEDPVALAAAREVLTQLRADMLAQGFGRTPVRLELTGRDDLAIRAINDALGEGEVSILVRGGRTARIQETAFAGVWRVLAYDEDGRLIEDAIEACAIPPRVIDAARAAAGTDIAVSEAPAGVMNSPALVNELRAASARVRDGAAAEVLNLTLLPLSQADLEHLTDTLGTGAITMLSRGYGNCRIASTALRDTWWVQYFNSMDRPILNTLEVVDVPEVALAAKEDWEDTLERLNERIAALTVE